MTPEIEKFKVSLAAKNASIMEVGGVEYKQLKDALDQISRELGDMERLMNRNRKILGDSDSTIRKLDLEIKRLHEEIADLNRAKLLLNADCEKNDKAG